MKPTFAKGIALGAVTSVLTLGTTAALAGTGPGAPFNLGKINKVNATSTLTGSATASMLKVPNTNTGAGAQAISASSASGTAATIRAQNTGGGPAAEFDVTPGHAPFTVNSATEVANLNAAMLQGTVPSDFYAAGSTVANSSQLGGQPPSFYLPATGTAANSSELGGEPPTAFLPEGGTAANSSELGGQPASDYMTSPGQIAFDTATINSGTTADVTIPSAVSHDYGLQLQCVSGTAGPIIIATGTTLQYWILPPDGQPELSGVLPLGKEEGSSGTTSTATWVVQVAFGSTMATTDWSATVNTSGTCTFAAQTISNG